MRISSSPYRGRLLTLLLVLMTSSDGLAAEGFYKDLFIDGGCYLTGRSSLAAAEYLGLTQEALFTPYEPVTEEHRQIQTAKLSGDENDSNGCLLYPDGSPRFRLLQTNGGSATGHGRSMGADGRQRVRDFYYAGGSYTGTCAGFFISSLTALEDGTINENYYHIWPARLFPSYVGDEYIGMFVEPGSPLLDYFDYGGDMYIASVRHNYGGYGIETEPDWPPETEILLRYDFPERPAMHEQVGCLAYKDSELSGRLVIIGSHPEGVESGERRDLMAAIIQYALAGQGDIRIKGELVPSQWRVMDRYWEDGEPQFARIGDKQLHHFTLDVPEDVTSLTIRLSGEEEYDLDLYLKYGEPAFSSVADETSTSAASEELLSLSQPQPGRYYVGVECYTTVTEEVEQWHSEYSGPLGVLNGVSYSIMAEYEVARTLRVVVPDTATEGQVVAGEVEVSGPSGELIVTLTSSSPEHVVVPETVSLSASNRRTFDLQVVEDDWMEADLTVTITACAEDLECASDTMLVLDNDAQAACADLAGICCAALSGCDGGNIMPANDCDRCCVGGSCVLPAEAESGAEMADTASNQDVWSDSMETLPTQGENSVVVNEGCACTSASEPESSPLSGLWLVAVLVALARRRTAGLRL